jgi:hypothetical protein
MDLCAIAPVRGEYRNCIRDYPTDRLTTGEISLQTRCLGVGAFGICVTAGGLLAAGRHAYE